MVGNSNECSDGLVCVVTGRLLVSVLMFTKCINYFDLARAIGR